MLVGIVILGSLFLLWTLRIGHFVLHTADTGKKGAMFDVMLPRGGYCTIDYLLSSLGVSITLS